MPSSPNDVRSHAANFFRVNGLSRKSISSSLLKQLRTALRPMLYILAFVFVAERTYQGVCGIT